MQKTKFMAIALILVCTACTSLKSKGEIARTNPLIKSSKSLAISTSEPQVAKVATEIFQRGGNIIDATVAASFAISVVRPQSTGIGGGGFLLYYDKNTNKNYAYDFRETAPLKATADMFLINGEVISGLSTTGTQAVAVPGMVAGLFDIHQAHGKLTWEEVLAPAIRLAESELPVIKHMADRVEIEKANIARDPELAKIFLPNGKPLKKGDKFKNSDLAETLKQIALYGKNYFYEGEFAKKLAGFMRDHEGLITRLDLRSYRVKVRDPIAKYWQDYRIVAFPPPSSGGIHLVQILGIYDKISETFKKSFKTTATGERAAEVEAMKRAFVDRAFLIGDPDFVSIPQKVLVSDKYFSKRADEISAHVPVLAANDITPWGTEKPSKETTHISLIDSEGNAVSTTQSVNGFFGAKVMVPGTGVILNNTMDDFSIKLSAANYWGLVSGKTNQIVPRKRPLSSMTPTLVFNQNGEVIVSLGSPGGSRIITQNYTVLSRYLREGLPAEEAIAACRFHHQWQPDKLVVEKACVDQFKELKSQYTIEEGTSFEVQMVAKEKDGSLISVTDPRGIGTPAVVEIP